MSGRSVQFRTGYKRGGVTGKGAQLQLHLKRKNQELLKKLLARSEKNLFQLLANNMKLLQKQAKKLLHPLVLRIKVQDCLDQKEANFTTLQRRKKM